MVDLEKDKIFNNIKKGIIDMKEEGAVPFHIIHNVQTLKDVKTFEGLGVMMDDSIEDGIAYVCEEKDMQDRLDKWREED